MDEGTVHQVTRVLKMRTGERIILCDGANHEAEYELVDSSAKRVGEIRKVGDVSRAVTLYAAILKRENFEWAVQKAVECGVSKIVPMITQRTIKKDVKRERLQEIAKEAAEQSGRGMVPEVTEPMDFGDAMKTAKGEIYFFDVGGKKLQASDFSDLISLFIGPEGGWDEHEIENAKRAGAAVASLGPRVLRGETACAVAVYLMTI